MTWDILHENVSCLSSWFWAAGSWRKEGLTAWEKDRHLAVSKSGYLWTKISNVFIGFTLFTSQIYSKNARRLAFSIPSFRVLQIREHLGFCCCVSDQVSCSQVHRGSSSRRSCSSLGHVMLPAGWSLVLASGGYGCIPPLACTVWPELWWWCLETLSH